MRFGMVGRMGPRMRQVVGFGIGPREGVSLGANVVRPIVTNGDCGAAVQNCANRHSCGFRWYVGSAEAFVYRWESTSCKGKGMFGVFVPDFYYWILEA